MASKSPWRYLLNIPAQVVQVLVVGSIFVTLMVPLGFPVAVTDKTQRGFDYIESLQPGDVAFFHMAYGAGGITNYAPATSSHTVHLARQGCKCIYYASVVDGPEIWEKLYNRWVLPTLAAEGISWVYGEDYVFLGFITGRETTFAALMADIREAKPTDWEGTPLDNLPLMSTVNSAADLKLVTTYTGGQDTVDGWVRQAYTRYGVEVIATVVSTITPSTMSYWLAGQVVGLQNDVVGAAEYESLVGVKYMATQIMDVLSLAQTIVLVFMIIGNVGTIGTWLTTRMVSPEVEE
jgi:hypothetical protein